MRETLADTLDSVLADVAFAAPVTVDDCTQVRDALREVLPEGTSLEVYCNKDDEVVIQADNVFRRVPVALTIDAVQGYICNP